MPKMEVRAYSRQVPWDRSLRCSDSDREAVEGILRSAHVAGRLDADEFAERFGRALEARTYAELDALVADLPAEEDLAPAVRWGYKAPLWGPSGWPSPGQGSQGPPAGPGYSEDPYGPLAPGRSAQRLWPASTLLLVWLAISLSVFALTGGHVLWLFLPIAWLVWAGRGGRWRWRRRSPNPPTQTWL